MLKRINPFENDGKQIILTKVKNGWTVAIPSNENDFEARLFNDAQLERARSNNTKNVLLDLVGNFKASTEAGNDITPSVILSQIYNAINRLYEVSEESAISEILPEGVKGKEPIQDYSGTSVFVNKKDMIKFLTTALPE